MEAAVKSPDFLFKKLQNDRSAQITAFIILATLLVLFIVLLYSIIKSPAIRVFQDDAELDIQQCVDQTSECLLFRSGLNSDLFPLNQYLTGTDAVPDYLNVPNNYLNVPNNYLNVPNNYLNVPNNYINTYLRSCILSLPKESGNLSFNNATLSITLGDSTQLSLTTDIKRTLDDSSIKSYDKFSSSQKVRYQYVKDKSEDLKMPLDLTDFDDLNIDVFQTEPSHSPSAVQDNSLFIIRDDKSTLNFQDYIFIARN